ncbi:hypothetical protein ACE1YR_08310 [Pseudomonas sp. K1(2024)]|uniref:DUF4234 domain-containing protein n=1 Tax=Pseudomonas boreofloridensis TaxID=3064348 RepID=A0ABV4Z733_9PSED|nr:hypothetical protein [Pseudomonas sp. K13]MDO7902295.1 hypothetical protein [Pseudomonas sp. K13]
MPDTTPVTTYAPDQPDQSIPPQATENRPFYVVSRGKFLTLWILSFGMYQLYWAFANWKQLERSTGEKLWPIARALFSVFFTHSLYREADTHLKRSGSDFRWNPMKLATLFVIVMLIATLAEVLSSHNIGLPIVELLNLGLLPVTGWVTWLGQRGLNAAAGDLEGRSNAQFTPVNYGFMMLGTLLLALACLGLILPAE